MGIAVAAYAGGFMLPFSCRPVDNGLAKRKQRCTGMRIQRLAPGDDVGTSQPAWIVSIGAVYPLLHRDARSNVGAHRESTRKPPLYRHASNVMSCLGLCIHNVALVAADYTGMPRRFAPTADFAYIRLIGKHGAFDKHRAVVDDRSETVRRWAAALP